MAVWRLASLLTLLTSPLLSPGEAKVVSEQAPAKEHQLEAAPYVGSYQVEDSCQFQLCGTQTFGAEFGPGLGPSEGSCSGDCHQLAVSLVTNRFTRDFLWSKCADMCSDKYNFSTYSDYKSRLSCMSSCFSLYSPLAPHHNLARYCIQASCPDPAQHQPMHQLDCFSQCSGHVSSRVASRDWEDWARALTATCQADRGQGSLHRLQCADDAVWNQTVAAVEHEQAAAMARHCRQEICRGNLACAATCLEHVMQVARAEAALDTWLACSTSPACSPSCSTASTCSVERLACSDQCLQRRRDEEAAAEAARRLGGTEQLAILASSAQLPGLAWPILVLGSTLVW